MPTYNRLKSKQKIPCVHRHEWLDLTVISANERRYFNGGRSVWTTFKANGGSLCRQRLTITQVTFRRKLTDISFWINSINGGITPNSIA